MPSPQGKKNQITPGNEFVRVPTYADTLFPVDLHSSTLTRGPLPPLQQGQRHQLYLPTVAWLNFLQPLPIYEHIEKGDTGQLTYWHSPDYPNGVSYGWRDRAAPSLTTFDGEIDRSDLKPCGFQLKRALRTFQRLLDRSWSREDLTKCSPLMASVAPDVRRDDLRFFFSTDLLANGGLLITVFLEATATEVQGRPKLYKNCNKHLHQSFFTQDGIVRRAPEHHGREVDIANRTEHTAYAKFYLQSWSGHPNGISILMHPAQRARLSYEPHNDRRYCDIRDILRLEIGHCRAMLGRIRHRKYEEAVALEDIAKHLSDLMSNARARETTLESIKKKESLIIQCLHRCPRLMLQSVFDQPRVKGTGAHSDRDFHRRIRALLGTVTQVVGMHQRRARGHEAEYRIADTHTGPHRELLFFAVMDLLKSAIDVEGLSAFRFLLSAQQIAVLRFAREDGNVRDKISVLPRILEKRYPIVTTYYPTQRVNKDGGVAQEFMYQGISTICLDSSEEKAIQSPRPSPSIGDGEGQLFS